MVHLKPPHSACRFAVFWVVFCVVALGLFENLGHFKALEYGRLNFLKPQHGQTLALKGKMTHQSKTQNRMTVRELRELKKQGFTHESPELNEAQRTAMERMDKAITPPWLPISSLKRPNFIGDMLKGLNEKTEAMFKQLKEPLVRIGDLIKNFDWLRAIAAQAVDAQRSGNIEEYNEAIEAGNKHISEAENPIEALSEYTGWVIEFSGMALEQLQQEVYEARQNIKKLNEELDKTRLAYQKRPQAKDKKAFMEWIQSENIVIEQIRDLLYLKNIPNHEWLFYNWDTLKKWYKEAMPDIPLKAGNRRKD
ncbi:MAG: hypothetical protein ACRCV6_07775 [Formosimonas sp.]